MKMQSMVSAQWWLLALLAGCSCAGPRAPQQVIVRARNFAFEAPDTISSGPTRIRLVNEGPSYHHVWLLRMSGGHTTDDLRAHFAAGNKEFPEWVTHVGGPSAPDKPGDSTEAVLDLAPGDYSLLCVIPDYGIPHFAQGMIQSLTVMPSQNRAVMPTSDVTLTLDDYSFVENRPLTAGRHTIRVDNAAAQEHEVIVFRLNPGKSGADMLAYFAKGADPAPGVLLGGTTGLSKGEFNLITLDLMPGKYFLICFVPDKGDGKSHFKHGMVRELEVRAA